MGLTALRVELKYRVPDALLSEFPRRLPAHEAHSYGVSTTYLDRRDRSLSRAALITPLRCLKIRLRDYGTQDAAVWVEIKVRSWAWTRKMRFRIAKAAVPSLLAGKPVAPILPQDTPPAALHDVSKAYALLRDHPDPRLVLFGCVTANRTTYQFPDDAVRFSLDRNIAYFAPPEHLYGAEIRPLAEQLGPPIGKLPHAVLEIKEGGTSPQWCREAAAGMELVHYSKFRGLIENLQAASGAPHVD